MEGHKFQLWTDHKLLLAALHRVSEPWTPRQQRQLSFIAECIGDVLHKPGVSNVVADSLSWPQDAPECHVAADISSSDCFSTGASAPVLDYCLMAAEHLAFPRGGHPTYQLQPGAGHTTRGWLYPPHDISMGTFRPVVPQSFKQQVFETMHAQHALPGMQASKHLILARFVFVFAAADVAAMAKRLPDLPTR